MTTPQEFYTAEEGDSFFNRLYRRHSVGRSNEITSVRLLRDYTPEDAELVTLECRQQSQWLFDLTFGWEYMDRIAAAWLLQRGFVLAKPGLPDQARILVQIDNPLSPKLDPDSVARAVDALLG